jgi:hypothetical protein
MRYTPEEIVEAIEKEQKDEFIELIFLIVSAFAFSAMFYSKIFNNIKR